MKIEDQKEYIKYDTISEVFIFTYNTNNITVVKSYYIYVCNETRVRGFPIKLSDIISNKEIMLSLYDSYKKLKKTQENFRVIYYVNHHALNSSYFRKLYNQGNIYVKKYKPIAYNEIIEKYQEDIKKYLITEINIEEYAEFTKNLEVHISPDKLSNVEIVNKFNFIDFSKYKKAYEDFSKDFVDKYNKLICGEGKYEITQEEFDRYLYQQDKDSFKTNELKLLSNAELFNLDEQKDTLNAHSYADSLVKILLDKNDLVVGFFGKWGSGKSSVINHMISECNNKNLKNLKFIKYDAWKYQKVSFYRTFLLTLENEFHKWGICKILKSILFKKQTQDLAPKNPRLLGWILLIAIYLCGAIYWNVKFHNIPLETLWKKPDMFFIPKFTIIFSIISGIFSFSFMLLSYVSYNRTKTSEFMFSDEEFETKFKTIMKKTETKKYNKNKFIIVIDNIDRCSNAEIYEKLKSLKMFLNIDSIKNISFLVPLDHEQVVQSLREYLKYDNREVYEFISKTFDTSLNLKPFDESTNFQYIEAFRIDLNQTCKNLIAYVSNSNPRMTKMLVNKILSEKEWIFNQYN